MDKFEQVLSHQKNSWADVKNVENYELIELTFPFGKRLCYKKKPEANNEMLQASRGLPFTQEDTFETLVEKVRQIEPMHVVDQVRIDELNSLNEKFNFFDKERDFFECGFRHPRLLRFYQDKFKTTRGCDISELNVRVSQTIGFPVELCDLTDTSAVSKLNLENVKLMVSYHVFEHLTNPLEAIQGLYQRADKGTYLHIEIPIEPGVPRFRYAHLFSFEYGDISSMAKIAGWKIVNYTDKVSPGGPAIERILVVKE